jgi:hypothetical protein
MTCSLYCLLDLTATDVTPQILPWKQFRHVADHSILKKMEDVCCLLGQYGDLNILSYHLLDMFHRCPHHCKEIIFLLNEILCGGMNCLLFLTYSCICIYLVLSELMSNKDEAEPFSFWQNKKVHVQFSHTFK